MDKRKVIIMTIISTIISLVMIFFAYYGVTRYLSLHFKSSKGLIEKYSQLPKASNGRVVISFTTTHERVNKIKPMLNSILDQSVKVDLIALIIQTEYKDKYNIPKYITDVANIFPAGKDYGDGTKLIPILLREKECNTIIVALNDDTVYGKDFIETIVDDAAKNPNTVLLDKSGSAILVKPEYFGCDVINEEREDFNTEWFVNRSKKNKVIDYDENYKSF